MSTRTIQRTRTNGWQNSIAASAALTTSTRTDDPFLSVVTAPMPTLVIRFGGGSGVSFGLAQSTPAARPMLDRPQEPARSPRDETSAAAPTPDQPVEQAQAGPEENPQPVAEQSPEPAPAEPEAVSEPGVDQPQEAAEMAARETSEAQSDQPPEPPRAESGKRAPNSNRIELIIDSLPSHPLSEPIPVVIDPLGDAMFTASMRDLEIAATGNSIGEALLFLKEQIDSTFNDLSRRASHLTHDQKTTLQMLHTYIAPQAPTKSRWF